MLDANRALETGKISAFNKRTDMGNKQDEETTLPIIVPDKKQGMPQEPVAESETTSHSG
jgi:hypothetical protein